MSVFFFLNVYFWAVLGLSCGTQDLQPLLWHAGSLVYSMQTLSCGMWDLVP